MDSVEDYAAQTWEIERRYYFQMAEECQVADTN